MKIHPLDRSQRRSARAPFSFTPSLCPKNNPLLYASECGGARTFQRRLPLGVSIKHALLPLRFLAIVLAIAFTSLVGQAQLDATQSSDVSRILGLIDSGVAMPPTLVPLGRKDANALQAIIDFLRATNGTAWTSLDAYGTMKTSNDNEDVRSATTLTMLHGDAFRLDVSAPEGERSIRIVGGTGAIMESDGTKHFLPPATSIHGPVAFPEIMTESFPGAQTSLVDQGSLIVDGKSLHRITIAEPLSAPISRNHAIEMSVQDLYFDSTTHLLTKSVGYVQLHPDHLSRYLQVITYGDYRTVSGILLPHLYEQTLNGQFQWSLQLDEVRLGSHADPSYFRF